MKALISNVYERIKQEVQAAIAAEPDSVILGTSIDELVEYYFNTRHFTGIELDDDREITSEITRRKKTIPAHMREGPFSQMGDTSFDFEYVTIRIPIHPHPQLKEVQKLEPSTYRTGFAGEGEPDWMDDHIKFDILFKGYGFNKSDDAIAHEATHSIEWMKQYFSLQARELERANSELKNVIRQAIINRKNKIESDTARYDSILKKIDIPVRRKQDQPVTRIQVNPKPVIQRLKPTPQQPEEYVLDRAKVLDIIAYLENQGRQLEQSPSATRKLGETDLRDLFLASLNAIFEGAATGETFSKRGKTDIYLNIAKGNILEFECKFWTGAQGYQETINQLLRYLTWRMNFGIIVLFADQKNFTHILEQGQVAIQSHATYQGQFATVSVTHFRSSHRLPEDDKKLVEIHHLFYNLYTA